MLRLGFSLLIAFALHAPLFAQDYDWVGGTASAETDWDTATNWSPNGVPGSGDKATISSSAAFQPELRTGGSISVDEIVLNAGASNAEVLVGPLGGASMNTFLTVGVITFNPGATGNANLTIEGGCSVTVSTTATFHSSLNHTSYLLGSGTFNMDMGSQLNVEDSQELPVDFQIPTYIGGDALISGRLLVSGNSIVDGGTFTVQGSAETTAQLHFQNTSTLRCEAGGQISGSGEWLFNSGCTADFDTTQTGILRLAANESTLSTPAILTGTANPIFNAVNSDSVTLLGHNGDGIWETSGNLRNDGNLFIDGASGLEFSIPAGTFTNGGFLTLYSETGVELHVVGAGTLVNDAGGTLDSAATESIAAEGEPAQSGGPAVNIACALDNLGTLQVHRDLNLLLDYTQSGVLSRLVLVDGDVADFNVGSGAGTALFNGGTVEGVGTLSANVVNNAVFAPGGTGVPGTIDIVGDYTQAMGPTADLGRVELEFSSAALFDRITVSGDATLGHRIDFSLINSFTPPPNTFFDNVFTVTGARAGGFTVFSVDAAVTSSDRYFNLEYNTGPNNVDVRFKSFPIPQAQTINAQAGTAFNGTLASVDLDNDTPGFQIVSPPAKGSVLITNTTTGAFAYTPNAGAAGGDSFTFRVFDGVVNSRFDAVVTVNLGAAASPPVISAVTASPDVTRQNANVAFTAVASDPGGLSLTYSWDFMDGTTGSGNPVTHAFSSTGVFLVTVTASNGSTTAQSSVSVTVFAPNSGGDSVINVGDGKPPVANPLNGLSVAVNSSNGGVVELAVNVDALNRAGFDVDTAFDGIAGRRANRKGLRPTEKFTEPGVAVATTVATDAGTTSERGKARRQIVVSSREVGQPEPFTSAPADRGISTQSMKGKFLFSSTKADQFTFTGTFELPAGLDVSQPRTLDIGIGNIIDSVQLDTKGKARNPALNRIVKAQIKYPKVPKDTKQTSAGQLAKLTLTMKGVDFSTQGFDTEGISATLRGDEAGQKSVPRSIQTAISFAGSTWEGTIPVNFKLAKDAESGQIQGRRAN